MTWAVCFCTLLPPFRGATILQTDGETSGSFSPPDGCQLHGRHGPASVSSEARPYLPLSVAGGTVRWRCRYVRSRDDNLRPWRRVQADRREALENASTLTVGAAGTEAGKAGWQSSCRASEGSTGQTDLGRDRVHLAGSFTASACASGFPRGGTKVRRSHPQRVRKAGGAPEVDRDPGQPNECVRRQDNQRRYGLGQSPDDRRWHLPCYPRTYLGCRHRDWWSLDHRDTQSG